MQRNDTSHMVKRRSLLIPEKLLALELVEFGNNVRNRVFDARNDDAVERIHAAIGDLERLVDRGQRRL